MSRCCGCKNRCACGRHSRRSRKIATLYYKLGGEAELEYVYAFDPELGLSYSSFNPETNNEGVNLPGSSGFFYNGNLLTDTDSVKIQENFTYKVDEANQFSAIGQYTESNLTPATQTRENTFAVTGGIGKFAKARKAVIEYDNVTNVRTVRVYA